MVPSPAAKGFRYTFHKGWVGLRTGLDIVKVNFTLEQATKAQKGSSGIALLSL
jgi:hypothetical protein